MHGTHHIDSNDNQPAATESKEASQIDSGTNTGGDPGEQIYPRPRACSLEGITEISRALLGIELATLVPFDTVDVRTVNSDYRLFLLDPETGRALLERCGLVTEAVEVRIVGSSFGGSILRTGWIGVGLRMEACANDRYIRTSPVQSLCVDHQTAP